MWTTGRPPNRLAALPAGRLGRLGGWIMGRGNREQQAEVLALAEVRPGEAVLEVGVGPGVLLGELTERVGVRRVVGLDPSAEMRAAARRRNAAAVQAGRVVVKAGTAAATGQPDDAFDVVISVNTVAIWPDLDAGVRELARVTRSGGRLLLSWHGGTSPTRMSGPLVLAEDVLARIQTALGEQFDLVRRARTERCEVFQADRSA